MPVCCFAPPALAVCRLGLELAFAAPCLGLELALAVCRFCLEPAALAAGRFGFGLLAFAAPCFGLELVALAACFAFGLADVAACFGFALVAFRVFDGAAISVLLPAAATPGGLAFLAISGEFPELLPGRLQHALGLVFGAALLHFADKPRQP